MRDGQRDEPQASEPVDGAIAAQEDVVVPEPLPGGVDDRDGHNPFPIVGIGASAGGLEAFTQLLSSLPSDSGMAFVLIQHLDPHHDSKLTDLLATTTAMPVHEATHGTKVQPNEVYVIPPNTNLAIAKGVLHITRRKDGRGPHLPVDFLFRSLAEDQQGRSVGVVLSGTGSDGTLGLCEIKAMGGITFAQDSKSAKHSGMPQSAVESGCVDFVLPPADIARRLAEMRAHPYLAQTARERPPEPDGELRKILAAVRSATGVDFSLYRDTTIRRRILRRMALHSQQSWGAYLQLLQSERGEAEALYHDLLINVTSFFRDPEMFEALKTRVFPELVKGRSPNAPIRVWIPGCSTGQEAYSIAMCLTEFYDDEPGRPPFQIFATDLSDQTALDKARAGIYPESIEAEVAPERLRRFFKREDHVYRIDKALRDMCVFARHNVTADPPFSHLDLISCRNVLIYLSTPLQKRIMPTFHYALNVPGFLVLGSAESVGEHGDLFDPVDRSNKIYAKKPATTRFPAYSSESARSFETPGLRRLSAALPALSDFQREADRLMLVRYGPASVLVNESFDIIQYRGATGAYLEAPAGEPTTNVLKMAREGLFIDLRAALSEAQSRNSSTRRDGVRLRSNGDSREIALEVVPVKPAGTEARSFLVLFHDTPAHQETPVSPEQPQEPAWAGDPDREITQLRQELAATKEYLHSLVEQHDAANEELRSANEEILSSNEELQSTNEELETAKEELQSANEELTTVNEQLAHRNVELTQLNNDMTNLMSSTNIPVVMVGSDLRIRRFTAPAKRVMNLLSTDIGRPISDIKPAISVPDLEEAIESVMESVQPQERVAQDRDGRWLSLRITPYRTQDNKIDGAVLLLVDVDLQKRAEQTLRDADHRKDEFLATLAHELRNPVSPILNAVEVLRLVPDDTARVAQARGVLDRQVRQLSRIVEDLIDVSRVVEKKVELRRERIALATVVETAMESCLAVVEGRSHRLTVSLPPEPVFIFADPVRLSQVVINLVNNAAKFTDVGGQIALSAQVRSDRAQRLERASSGPPPQSPYLELKVRDNGIGIAADEQPHLFEMFSQADRREVVHSGLGIGLSLAQALVEMHGGDIGVESAGLGSGSVFTVRIPLDLDRADRSRGLNTSAPAVAQTPRRVLVVDDNEDQAESLAMLLNVLGHETRIAYDGLSAVSAATEFEPDVALVDIGIPGINGYEVARRIRGLPRLSHTMLVAQTGWGTEEDRSRSHAAGFDHHLVKPIVLSELQRILDGSPARASAS